MLQLPQRLRFNLPDALSRDRELLANLLERVVECRTRQSPGLAVRATSCDAEVPRYLPSSSRWIETAAACFDCRLSQEILDGVNGWLTT